jgi:hypothetical protein
MNRKTLIERLRRLLPLKNDQWPSLSGVPTLTNQIQAAAISSTTVILDRLDSIATLVESSNPQSGTKRLPCKHPADALTGGRGGRAFCAWCEEVDGQRERLEDALFSFMKMGVKAVVDGSAQIYEAKLMSPDHIYNYLLSLGFDTDEFEMETNGWQWDYWQEFKFNDIHYQLSGSGFHGGAKFCRKKDNS